MFPKTRTAAGYAARHARGELARGRAAVLLTRLDACEDIPAGGDVPAVFHGVLRDLVLAARDLAGPAWIAASGDDPDIAAFTALQATPIPPSPAELDEIISRVLWARFAAPGTPRDGDGGPGPAPGAEAGHDMAVRGHVPGGHRLDRRGGRRPGRGRQPTPPARPGPARPSRRAGERGEQATDGTLTVQVRHQPGYSIITVAGEVDIVTAPRLRERLAALAGAGRPVIADLAQVSFIGAAGLRVLATAARQAAGSGGSLHVVSDRYVVWRLFTVTGLDRQIPLAHTRAEALAALRAGRDMNGGGTGGKPARRVLAWTTSHKQSDNKPPVRR